MLTHHQGEKHASSEQNKLFNVSRSFSNSCTAFLTLLFMLICQRLYYTWISYELQLNSSSNLETLHLLSSSMLCNGFWVSTFNICGILYKRLAVSVNNRTSLKFRCTCKKSVVWWCIVLTELPVKLLPLQTFCSNKQYPTAEWPRPDQSSMVKDRGCHMLPCEAVLQTQIYISKSPALPYIDIHTHTQCSPISTAICLKP